MSLYVIVPDAPEVREHVDAIRQFCRPEDLPALIRQYGSEMELAMANFAHYSDVHSGAYVLLESGEPVATAEYGLVHVGETPKLWRAA